MNCIRYVIKLRNGSYMKQDFDGSLERIKIRAIDNPIDADLLRDKGLAERVIDEILTGNTNILVLYDDNNPPVEVIEINITMKL
jgi:hypothetical protein